MKTYTGKKPTNASFNEILAFATEDIYNTFLQMYNDGQVNNKIDKIIIDEKEKKDFFKYINQKYINCYAIVTLKYFTNPGILK